LDGKASQILKQADIAGVLAPTEPPRRRGRPRREEAEQRHAEMLEKALDMFLDQGFEQTTIDAIAASLGMTKRTIYVRYEDKAALFKAAVQQAIERWIMPEDALESLPTDDIEAALLGIARLRIAHMLTPIGQKMHRVLNAESYRFPEILDAAYEQGSRPVIAFLARVLARHHARGAIHVERPEMAAAIFLGMVVAVPTRKLVTGAVADPADIEDRLTYSVTLFLDGLRPR
jgi:AcrR family transcriptional regulator